MTVYAAQADITDRYGQNILDAVDRDGDGQPDLAAVDKALADASGLIDTYLASRYSLPLPSVPELLTRLCVDVALYQLVRGGTAAAEDQRLRYEDAIQTLRDIGAGRAALDLPAPQSDARKDVHTSGQARLFTRDTLKGI